MSNVIVSGARYERRVCDRCCTLQVCALGRTQYLCLFCVIAHPVWQVMTATEQGMVSETYRRAAIELHAAAETKRCLTETDRAWLEGLV